MKRLRTIKAVFRKEFIQFVRYPTWIISALIWPLIFPLMYILSALGMAGPDQSGLAAFKAATGTNSYMGFIVVGTMAWMWVNMTMWNFGSYLREEQIRGTLESTWLCPVNKVDLLLGGGLNNLLINFIMVAISIVEYKFIYGIDFKGNILVWVVMFLIMTPAVYGIGMLFSSVTLWLKEINATVNVVRGLMNMLCGITFPIAIMPIWMQNAAKAIPFTYGIEATRQIMINGASFSQVKFDIFMCLLEGAILLMLGRLAFMSIERKVRLAGSLERF